MTPEPDQTGDPQLLLEGRPRFFDADYERDLLDYRRLIHGILRLLSVRAQPSVHALLLTVPIRILNRGRVEAFVSRGSVYVDMALLDQLWVFSFEQGVADIKRDPYHMLDFTLTYANALHSHTGYQQLDPYNSAHLTDEQFRQLWDRARDVQAIAFENTLSFLLAHEVGHMVLAHELELGKRFADAATRRADNASWILWRRETELAADRLAARLSLDAAYQPAQVLPWLDLVEVRRSFYGSSAEYPTPGQRASAIWSAYAERFGGDGIDTSGLARVDPLPPDRDMSKVDRARNLENMRRVREFRRAFLVELDSQVGDVLQETREPTQAATWFLWRVKAYRGLLYGAEDPVAVDEALSFLAASYGSVDRGAATRRLLSLFERAFRAPEVVQLLSAYVDADTIHVDELRPLLTWGREGSPMFADALELGYLLANTRYLWNSNVFQALLAGLPDAERARLHLSPCQVGAPARARRFTIEERVRALDRWDGSYAEAFQDTQLRH